MTTENTVDAILITGTADNDSIINFGDDVTIDSGSGNDTIYSGLDDRKADRVSINAGAGDNVVSIQGGSDSVTIRTGDGNNLIGSTSPNNAVFSGAGNDSVVFYTGSDNNTVETGEGDDVIQAVGHNVTIDAGGDNDKIRTFRNAYDITIKPGAGDDDITLGGPVETDHTNVVQYAEGDGFDTISALTATDTLQITSGSISGASLVGNNVEISVGSGKITLVEANDMNINIVDADGILHQTIFSGGDTISTVVNDTLIAGTDGEDYLINDKGKNVTINAFGGNDTIDNTGDNSIIDAGAGDDIVSVAGASNVTIRTGEDDNRVYTDNNGANELVYFGNGNNTIVTSNRRSTILGGNGNDLITFHNGSFGSSVETGSGNDTVQVGHYDITVDAGAGNDLINLYRDAENALIIPGDGNDTITVYNNTHAQTFQYSGGNDLINGFKSIDTLKIVGPTSANTIVSDGNLIFDFGDGGTLTLAGVSSVESLNVEYLNKWSTIDGGFVYSGHASNNYAKTADVSLIGSELKDTNGDGAPDNITVNAFNYSSITGVMAFMSGFGGEVTLNNKDVGVISDDDYEIHFTAKVIDNAPANVIAYTNTKEVRGISTGATVNPNESDMVGFDSNAKSHVGDVTKFLLYNKNHKGGGSPHATIGIDNNGAGADLTFKNDILTEIGGLNDGYSFSIISSDNISDELKFNDVGSGSLEFTSNIDDTVQVNFSGTSSAQSITGSGNSIELIGSSDDDLLIAGATNTTLTGGKGSDTFRGGAGLTNCVITDYTEGEDVIYHGRSFSDFSINGSISGNDYIFAAGERTITVKNGADKIIKGVDVNGDERLFGKYLTLDDNDAATVTAQDGVATIDAVLRTEDIVINGNSGDNTIISSSGNCTLYGGAGSDLFVSGAGNDFITDYTPSEDKISLGAAVSSSYISGAAVVLTTDAGTLTIQNANGKTLSLIDSAGKEFSIKASNTTEIINDVTAQASSVESVAADATGNQNITLESGTAAIVEDTSAKVNITASAGNDTIVSTGKHVDIDLKAGGATKIYAAEGRATVENYNAKTGAAFLTENENIADAIEEKSIAYDDGKLTVNSAQVTFADEVDSRFINFVEKDDDTQKVGFVSDDSKLDASSESGNLILVGANNSTLTGGTGKNQIYLDDNSESTILLNGRNTINNFNASFDDGDKVSVDATNHDFNFDGVNLKITSGSARATLQNISSDADSIKILTVTNGKEIKTAIAQAGAVITTGNELADVYYGKKSGVDFSAYDESLTIDLNKNFSGINQITVGGGLNTLFSSSANETLTGNSNGTTQFIFDVGAGHDLIQNFNFDEDKISVGSAVSNVVLRKSGDVIIRLGEEWITLEDAQGKTFRINDFAAQVDANISYNDAANYFLATAKNASVTVGEEAEIWLDGSHGKSFVGNIKTLDASNSDGRNTLAGNDADNIICAGAGDASLWGAGGDDLLVGGKARNLFFYTAGNDTIQSANDGDAVILSDISLDQIISTNISTDAVSINFIDGGSLQINGSADVTYQLADGSKFSANHQNSEWLKSN